MEIDAELRRQTVASLFAVGLFLASLVAIGVVFNGTDGFDPTGGFALVAALGGFVLLMAAVGFGLARADD
jgi:hypothetical protein